MGEQRGDRVAVGLHQPDRGTEFAAVAQLDPTTSIFLLGKGSERGGTAAAVMPTRRTRRWSTSTVSPAPGGRGSRWFIVHPGRPVAAGPLVDHGERLAW